MPDEIRCTSFDAVVIGAGPAGCVAAHGLASAGVATLLVERSSFPRPKVCGGCVSPRAAGMLERRGLGRALAGAATAGALRVVWGDAAALVRVAPRAVVDRSAFDASLAHAACAAGAVFIGGRSARVGASGVTLRHPEGQTRSVAARVVIVADGLGGSSLRDDPRFGWTIAVRSPIGVGTIIDAPLSALAARAEPGGVLMLCGPRGYAGLATLADGRMVVAGAARRTETGGAAGTLAALLGVSAEGGTLGRVLGVPRLTRTRRAVEADGRLFVIGDASGYVEPFTGEGMGWGIEHAELVIGHALAACRGAYTPGAWSVQLAGLRRRRERACRGVGAVLGRPRLGASVVGACASVPALGDGLCTLIGGRRTRWAT